MYPLFVLFLLRYDIAGMEKPMDPTKCSSVSVVGVVGGGVHDTGCQYYHQNRGADTRWANTRWATRGGPHEVGQHEEGQLE